jgi:hypothetical protein
MDTICESKKNIICGCCKKVINCHCETEVGIPPHQKSCLSNSSYPRTILDFEGIETHICSYLCIKKFKMEDNEKKAKILNMKFVTIEYRGYCSTTFYDPEKENEDDVREGAYYDMIEQYDDIHRKNFIITKVKKN